MSEGTTAENRPDDVLLARVRAGDTSAFEELYREHVEGARHLARILVGAEQADELTAESFARVLAQLRAGKGPTSNFRSYLHVTVRNGYRDGLRATREAPASDQPWLFDDAEPPAEAMVDGFDETVAVDALSSLPESWQQVLWHVEVEGRKPSEVAGLLDMRPGAVSSLAHRAREGLKRAYLDLQVGPAPAAQRCRWTHARMSQYARGDLGDKARTRFEAHVETCETCAAALATVDAVNRKLAAYVLPVVLVAVAPGSGKAFLWLGGTGGLAASSSGTGGSGTGGGLSATSGPGAAAASVAVAAVVAAAVWGIAAASGDDPDRLRGAAEEASPTAPADPSTSAVDPGATDPPTRAPKPDPPDRRPGDQGVAPVVDTGPDDVPGDPEVPVDPDVAPDPTDEPSDGPDPSPDPTDDPEPDPDPEPELVVVRPERPTAQRITACETYGSVLLPSTTGVTYQLTGGREGQWTVVASAEPGYVVAEGARTRWSGDLGAWYPCEVTLEPPSVQWMGFWDWRVTTAVDVPGGDAKTVELIIDLDDTPLDLVPSGDGWTCTTVARQMVSCTFAYTGTAPGPVSIDARGLPWMAGTATLLVDGVEVDSRRFSPISRTEPASRGERTAAPPAPAPVPEEPVVEEPVVEEPVVEEPVAEEPVVEEPVVEEPVVEEPVVEEPVADEPLAEEPVSDEPVEPEVDEAPVTEEPAADQAPAADAVPVG